MPTRIDLNEGQYVEVGGIPVAISIARGGQVVLAVGGNDPDGLAETPEACKRSAAKMRQAIDTARKKRKGTA